MAVGRVGNLFSWGDGKLGCLGFGDSRNKLVPTLCPFFTGKRVIDAACGENFTVVIAEVEGNPTDKVKVKIETGSFNLVQLRKAITRRLSTVEGASAAIKDQLKSNRKTLSGG